MRALGRGTFDFFLRRHSEPPSGEESLLDFLRL
jgi:hypothetical protein